MYAVTVTFVVKPEMMPSFLPLMARNARISRKVETGCQHFDVCRDGDIVFLYEVYDDRTAFDAHLASAHFQEFDAAVSSMIQEKQVRLFNEVIR
ncbi:putative quinol monooxygenase [Shimia abyssi]|uniref:Quinol monooxygenase YgiN n=1 Tax=Shimia abyssi TaxID=1662395 RepID=A0A2P8FF80_9RHOB|nr:putative quinol monooxygenase [Shimia abyssi]PSL20369.1 quinol monooxygenase YgiN [Shimia abyssi]